MRLVGTCPVKQTRGTLSKLAVAMPVTRLVAPGPLVTRQTPVLPVARAYPSAACTSPCSWRGSTTLNAVSPYSASKISIAMPPGYAKRVSTPSSLSAFTNSCVPLIFMINLPFRPRLCADSLRKNRPEQRSLFRAADLPCYHLNSGKPPLSARCRRAFRTPIPVLL